MRSRCLSARLVPAMVVAVLLAFAAPLAACGMANRGAAGITVGDDGSLVVVLAWCRSAPTEIIISHHVLDGPPGNETVDLTLKATGRLRGGTARVNLTHPGGDWAIATGPNAPLDPGTRYKAYGQRVNDNAFTTMWVHFTPAVTGSLRPGQVLVPRQTADNDYEDTLVGQSWFDHHGRSLC